MWIYLHRGKKAKMWIVVIFGRYNYKWFLFASLNASVCSKVEKYDYLKRWCQNSSEERIWLWRNASKAQGLEAEAWRAWPKGETESQGSVVKDLRIRGGLETRDAQWEVTELLARTWDTLPLWNEGVSSFQPRLSKRMSLSLRPNWPLRNLHVWSPP